MERGAFIVSFVDKADCSFDESINVLLLQLIQNIALCLVVSAYRQDVVREHNQSIQCLGFCSLFDLGGRTARSLQRNV